MFIVRCLAVLLVAFACTSSIAEQAAVPKYKPSSRSPEAISILTNEYGASRSAPQALAIGQRVPAFTLARVGGGTISLAELVKQGPAVLIFYRGHW